MTVETPTLSSLISKHSDAKRQGTTFGLFHMLSSLARVIGPAVATAVYTGHHTAPFLVAGVMTLAIAGWTVLLWRTVPGEAGAGDAIHPLVPQGATSPGEA